MKRFNLIPIISFLSLFIFNANAQDSTEVQEPRFRSIQLNYGFGFMKTDFSTLNSRLNQIGLKSLPENIHAFNIGYSGYIQRILLSSYFQYYQGGIVTNSNNTNMNFSGFGFGHIVGYTILDKKNYRIAPYAGLNVNFSKLKLTDKSTANNFSALQDSQSKGREIEFTNLALDLGVEADKLIFVKNKSSWTHAHTAPYVSLGIKIGYMFRLDNSESSKGTINNKTIEDAPVFGLNGPYIKLNIGLGNKIRQMKWK